MADLTSRSNITKKDALDFHKNKKPGKLSISASKPLSTSRDLSLKYLRLKDHSLIKKMKLDKNKKIA